MGCGVWGAGYGVWGMGYGVWGMERVKSEIMMQNGGKKRVQNRKTWKKQVKEVSNKSK